MEPRHLVRILTAVGMDSFGFLGVWTMESDRKVGVVGRVRAAFIGEGPGEEMDGGLR